MLGIMDANLPDLLEAGSTAIGEPPSFETFLQIGSDQHRRLHVGFVGIKSLGDGGSSRIRTVALNQEVPLKGDGSLGCGSQLLSTPLRQFSIIRDDGYFRIALAGGEHELLFRDDVPAGQMDLGRGADELGVLAGFPCHGAILAVKRTVSIRKARGSKYCYGLLP